MRFHFPVHVNGRLIMVSNKRSFKYNSKFILLLAWNEETNRDKLWISGYSINCDFPGNEFRRENNSSEQQCARKCDETSECTHYSSIDEICYLKSGHVSKDKSVFKFGSLCGFKVSLISGNDIISFEAVYISIFSFIKP